MGRNLTGAWTDERVARLKDLFARGTSFSRIAVDLGVSRGCVKAKARRLGLRVDKDQAKSRKDAWHRQQRGKAEATRVTQAPRLERSASKTSPEYRRRFSPCGPMTKREMRDQLRQAVLNTGGYLA